MSGYGTVSMSADLSVFLPVHLPLSLLLRPWMCLSSFLFISACMSVQRLNASEKDVQTKKDVLMMYRCGLFSPSYPI